MFRRTGKSPSPRRGFDTTMTVRDAEVSAAGRARRWVGRSVALGRSATAARWSPLQRREASEEQHGSVYVRPAPATLKEAPIVFQINQRPGIPPLRAGGCDR
jgi:hypothetical protein